MPVVQKKLPTSLPTDGCGPLSTRIAELRFDPAAPEQLAAAAAAGDVARFARQLCKRGLFNSASDRRWQRATMLQQLGLFAAGETASLDLLTREALADCLQGPSRTSASNHAAALLEAADQSGGASPRYVGVWLTLLSAAAPALEPDLLVRFWLRLLDECRRLQNNSPADGHDENASFRDEALWRGGLVFRSLSESQEWLEAAGDRWRARLANACDDEGVPQEEILIRGEAVGAFSRASLDAKMGDVELWGTDDLPRLRKFSARLAAFSNPRGGLALARSNADALTLAVQALLKLTGWKRTGAPRRLIAAAQQALQKGRDAATKLDDDVPSGRSQKPDCCFQSDAARVALLRTDWRPEASRCAITYPRAQPMIDVLLDGVPWLAGQWGLEIRINEAPRELGSGWKCECWYTDGDADFIELSCPLGEGLSATRQVLLARRESLLVFMDAVRGVPEDATVLLRSSLPLAPGVRTEADGATREIQLLQATGRVRVFPASLPPERGSSSDGSLTADFNELQFCATSRGSLCQVLMLEWSDKKGRRPADWSPLSVAEDGRRLPARDAVAARLRVNGRQWLYWHNLTAGEIPRTALGHHTASETIVARFSGTGLIEPLVHVDGDASEEN